MKNIAVISMLALAAPTLAQAAYPDCPLVSDGHREVSISQGPSGLTADPDTCHVKSGDVLTFSGDGSFEFDIDFTGSTPDPSGQKNFHSSGSQVDVKVKKPKKQESSPYNLKLAGAAAGADPAIIVDP